MTIELWLAYLGTVLLLMSTPGPSHLLMLSNSLSSGFPRSLATASGDLCANFLQMTAAAFGLATIISTSQTLFLTIKWLGVAYLVYLGIKLWREADGHIENKSKVSMSTLYYQGFITSAANPKAVVFFAALFPQFLDPTQSITLQCVILGGTYLLIDGIFLCFYGFSAGWLGKRIKKRGASILRKVSGVLLIAAALALGSREVNSKG